MPLPLPGGAGFVFWPWYRALLRMLLLSAPSPCQHHFWGGFVVTPLSEFCCCAVKLFPWSLKPGTKGASVIVKMSTSISVTPSVKLVLIALGTSVSFCSLRGGKCSQCFENH